MGLLRRKQEGDVAGQTDGRLPARMRMNGYRPRTDECYRAANGRVLPHIRRWDGRTRRVKGVSRNVTRPGTAAKGRRPTETDRRAPVPLTPDKGTGHQVRVRQDFSSLSAR